MMHHDPTDIPGIRIGHVTDLEGATGCTVMLLPPGTVAGVDQRGGAPGSRETDLLRPMHLVQHIDAIVLAGGSAFGLAAADGVVRYLEERGVGFETPFARVPIVPAAILYDLNVGRADRRPDAAMGYLACQNAGGGPALQGCVGAGTGATVGKLLGTPTKGGIGAAGRDLGGGLIVTALMAVNAVGEVRDETGAILAGARDPDTARGPRFIPSLDILQARHVAVSGAGMHTVIGIVATNGRLDRDGVSKVAQMAHNGIAQAVRPAHTLFDGDTIFAVATGGVAGDVNLIGAFAAEITAQAIRSAVRQAVSLAGVPSAHEFLAGRG